MKKIILLLVLGAVCLSVKAQKTNELATRIAAIEDRIAIKNVVDTFSVLADVKDVKTQVLLFTEDAIVESKVQGQPGMILKGRKQIGDAFSAFLSLFEIVYHINGQQTVALNRDRATATSYCMVTLIGQQGGKKMKTTMGIHYNDEFVKQNGRWFIAKRTSNFAWQEVQPFGQQ